MRRYTPLPLMSATRGGVVLAFEYAYFLALLMNHKSIEKTGTRPVLSNVCRVGRTWLHKSMSVSMISHSRDFLPCPRLNSDVLGIGKVRLRCLQVLHSTQTYNDADSIIQPVPNTLTVTSDVVGG